MQIKKLRPDLERKVIRYGLREKYAKAKILFEENPRRPSLHFELLEPRQFRIYSFRIDHKFRAVFIITRGGIEVTDVNLYYR